MFGSKLNRPHSPAGVRTSAVGAGGLGGTPGGVRASAGPFSFHATSDELYLWILVFLEVAAIGWLRHAFRRYHGG